MGVFAGPRILSALFVALLFVPLLEQRFKLIELSGVKEGRNKARLRPLAEVGLLHFPQAFERYYQDNFGFRDFLIKINNSVQYHVFGTSPTKQVIKGRAGWLYLSAGTGLDPSGMTWVFSAADLKRMQSFYEQRYAKLKSMGIQYLLIVPPNKNSIYPEFYPKHLKADARCAYDQFVSHMLTHSNVPIVDMKAELMAAKSQYELYFRTDSHWNDIGAFIGYSAAARKLKSLFPQIEPALFSDFVSYKRPAAAGLVRMLGVFNPPESESLYLKSKEPDHWYNYWRRHRSRHAPFVVRRDNLINGVIAPGADLIPKAIIYRDSFFARLAPFMSRHFRQVIMLSTQFNKFDRKYIEAEKPDIVIEELVERNLKVPGGKRSKAKLRK